MNILTKSKIKELIEKVENHWFTISGVNFEDIIWDLQIQYRYDIEDYTTDTDIDFRYIESLNYICTFYNSRAFIKTKDTNKYIIPKQKIKYWIWIQKDKAKILDYQKWVLSILTQAGYNYKIFYQLTDNNNEEDI